MSGYEFVPTEVLDEDDDDGTMPANVARLAGEVVGHRIVKAERVELAREYSWQESDAFYITLDTGKAVRLLPGGDCCAYTELQEFLLAPEAVDHVITGVRTADGYQTWSIFADFGDVLTLKVGWSCGNPFYYGYGFQIDVVEPDAVVVDRG